MQEKLQQDLFYSDEEALEAQRRRKVVEEYNSLEDGDIVLVTFKEGDRERVLECKAYRDPKTGKLEFVTSDLRKPCSWTLAEIISISLLKLAEDAGEWGETLEDTVEKGAYEKINEGDYIEIIFTEDAMKIARTENNYVDFVTFSSGSSRGLTGKVIKKGAQKMTIKVMGGEKENELLEVEKDHISQVKNYGQVGISNVASKK